MLNISERYQLAMAESLDPDLPSDKSKEPNEENTSNNDTPGKELESGEENIYDKPKNNKPVVSVQNINPDILCISEEATGDKKEKRKGLCVEDPYTNTGGARAKRSIEKNSTTIEPEFQIVAEECIQNLYLYKPEFNSELVFCNAKVLKDIATYIQKTFENIYSCTPLVIKNKAALDCSENNRDKIARILESLNNPEIPAFENVTEVQQSKIVSFLADDLNNLRSYARRLLNAHDERIESFGTAWNKISDTNQKHNTRFTSNILKKGHDIPSVTSKGLTQNKQSKSNLPWNNVLQEKEDDVAEQLLLEQQLLESKIISFLLQQRAIPNSIGPDWAIDTAVTWLNNSLINFGIKLSPADPNLEAVLINILNNKGIKKMLMAASEVSMDILPFSKDTNHYMDVQAAKAMQNHDHAQKENMQANKNFEEKIPQKHDPPIMGRVNQMLKAPSVYSSHGNISFQVGKSKGNPPNMIAEHQNGTNNWNAGNNLNHQSNMAQLEQELRNMELRRKAQTTPTMLEEIKHAQKQVRYQPYLQSTPGKGNSRQAPMLDGTCFVSKQPEKGVKLQDRHNMENPPEREKYHLSHQVQYNQHYSPIVFKGANLDDRCPNVSQSPSLLRDNQYPEKHKQSSVLFEIFQDKKKDHYSSGMNDYYKGQHNHEDPGPKNFRGNPYNPKFMGKENIDPGASSQCEAYDDNFKEKSYTQGYMEKGGNNYGNKTQNPRLPVLQTDHNQQRSISKYTRTRIKKLAAELDQILDSTKHSKRIIRKLEQFSEFSYQELQEVSKKMSEFTNNVKNHRKMQVEFEKELIEVEEDLLDFSPSLHQEFVDARDDAKRTASRLTDLISSLEERITEDKVSTTSVSNHDRTQLQYYEFSGDSSYSEMNIYEVITNHENIFKILSTSETMKGTVLKSHLKGHAKNCISEDLIDYAQIKEILIKNFGNKSRIISDLLKEHVRVGVTPPKSGNNVDWAQISIACQDHLGILRRANNIIKLDNSGIINEIYVNDIAAFLSQEDRIKIINTIGVNPKKAYDEIMEAFKSTLELSIDMRRITLSQDKMAKPRMSSLEKSKPITPLKPRTRNNIKYDFENEHALAAAFKTDDSIKDRPDCEICLKLREIGRGGKFFEKHLFNRAGVSWNSYCPNYIMLNIHEKNDFVLTNNFCRFCLEQKKQGHNSEECKSNNIGKGQGRMAFFKCSVPQCPERYELCLHHQDKNKKKILGMSERYQATVETVLTSLIASHPCPIKPKPFTKLPTSFRPWLKSSRENLIKDFNIQREYNKEFTKPIFMFQQIQGRTRGINTVYDSAASALITKHSIPGNELRASKRDPTGIMVQGLGSAVNDVLSWDILLPLPNSKYIASRAYSVGEIVKSLNLPNIKDAHKLIKDEFQNNQEVQQSQIYNSLRGEVEILMGIRLNGIFPQRVVQLNNGLALYKLQIASQHEEKNYCLGGPYEVVSQIMKHFPESALLFKEVQIGLTEFNKGNGPKIERLLTMEPLPEETVLMANLCETIEIENNPAEQAAKILEDYTDIEPSCTCTQANRIEHCFLSIGIQEDQEWPHKSNRYKKNKGEKKKIANPSSMVRDLYVIFDTPDIGYRCPDCQKCGNCKTKISQEKISLKGQLEEHLINQAITLDKEKKCFIAKLPLTESAEEKLIPNKEEAKHRCIKELQKLKNSPNDVPMIQAEFGKLLDSKYATKLSELPESTQQKIKEQKTAYFIPWSVVTKVTSVSTAKRIVYDASAKTKSKLSLNDICAKGSPNLDFDPMVMNFCANKHGLVTDLKKFYHSVHLHEDHYHLQMIWWTESMDPAQEPEIYVITRLTFGVSSSSQLLERAMELLAEDNKQNEKLYRFITTTRYVDDCMSSFESEEEVEELTQDMKTILPEYGLEPKGFAMSYKTPDSSIANDNTLFAGGYIWEPIKDILKVRIQPLHYAEKKKGQIMTENIFCNGTLEELDKFVPKDLTLRQVLSRASQIYDPLGLLTPWKSGLKTITRESMQEVDLNWDEPLSEQTRRKWINKFYEYQAIAKIEFKRNTLPLDMSCSNPEIICFVDAGRLCKVEVCYLLFQISEEEWNTQMLYSKSQISNVDKTIPIQELEALHMGANILNKCYNSLRGIKRITLVGDSKAASYWTAKDTISLATFVRNRVLDIRRLMDLDHICITGTKNNPADIGTKEIEQVSSIEPGSTFNVGPNFLKKGIDEALKSKILTPVKQVIQETHKNTTNETWKSITDGLLGKCSWPVEMLTKESIPAMIANEWVSKVVERYEFSNYVIDPMKRTWPSVIRILSIVYYYIFKLLTKAAAKTKTKGKTSLGKILRRMFKNNNVVQLDRFSHPLTTLVVSEVENGISTDSKEVPTIVASINKIENSIPNSSEEQRGLSEMKARLKCNQEKKIYILDLFENGFIASHFKKIAILYMLKKASEELEQFYVPSILKKHCFKVNGIVYSKNRWNEATEVKSAIGNPAQNMEMLANAPAMDMHCPVAIALAMHIHHNIANHQGVDRSRFLHFEYVYIFKATRLFTEIVQDCFKCRQKLKRHYKEIMGPLSSNQLTFGAIGRYIMIDLSGPYYTKIAIRPPTRGYPNTQKTWLLHSVCLVSHYSVAQVVEDNTTETFLEAIHQMSLFLGYPQLILMDSSPTFIHGLKDGEFSFQDASNKLYLETGITFKLCGTGGSSHYKHGLIEKRIDLFKRFFEKSHTVIEDLTSLQFNLHANKAASFLNSMPLATKNRSDGTLCSKYITPRSFLLGTLASTRAPDSLPTLPDSFSQTLTERNDWTMAMKKFFFERVPDLLLRTKWHHEGKERINVDDIVLFNKNDGRFSPDWKRGRVIELELSKDNRARIAHVLYIQNPNTENEAEFATRKAVNTLVKIYSIHDKGINWNLKEVNDNIKTFINTPTLKLFDDKNGPELDSDPVTSNIRNGHTGLQLSYAIQKGLKSTANPKVPNRATNKRAKVSKEQPPNNEESIGNSAINNENKLTEASKQNEINSITEPALTETALPVEHEAAAAAQEPQNANPLPQRGTENKDQTNKGASSSNDRIRTLRPRRFNKATESYGSTPKKVYKLNKAGNKSKKSRKVTEKTQPPNQESTVSSQDNPLSKEPRSNWSEKAKADRNTRPSNSRIRSLRPRVPKAI